MVSIKVQRSVKIELNCNKLKKTLDKMIKIVYNILYRIK